MVVFALVVIALATVATAGARVLWRKLDPAGAADTGPLELLTAGTLIGVSTWIGISWTLALTHTLRRLPLWLCVAVLLASAAIIIARRVRTFAPPQLTRESVFALLFLLPLFLWLIYILWRGVVLPVASHDALAYHLPKAVLLERAAGYEYFDAPDARIPRFAFNYELLLAEVLILGKTDAYTEWVTTVAFLLFLLAAAALAERWWRSRPLATAAAVMATASAPVLLLHSGAHKNDLLVAWFSLCALMWGSRWVVQRGRMPMLLTMLALGTGFGTKTTVAAIGLALAPFLLDRFVRSLRARSIRMRDLAIVTAGAVAIVVLGGGFFMIANYAYIRNATAANTVARGVADSVVFQYGDWQNIWQVPYLLLTIPFSSTPEGVWVPWRNESWFWPHYEIYFSHYGRLITLCALAAPFAIRRFGSKMDVGRRRERIVTIAAACLAMLIMLPTVFRPVGFFGAFARYFAFIVPIIACAALPPIVDAVSHRLRALIATAIAAVFVIEAVICANNDRFAPFDYALWAARHPGTRFIFFLPNRAGSIVDRMAGPHDKIAVDGAFDTWVYPAYGKDRTRPVVFLPKDTTPDTIPADAKWVMIDRSWDKLWSNPNFENLGQMEQFIGRGKPTADDVRLLSALRRDRRFKLVYADPDLNQAVFARIGR